MAQELLEGHLPGPLQPGQIVADRLIEGQLSGFDQLHDRRGRVKFGAGEKVISRRGRRRPPLLKIGITKRARPDEVPAINHDVFQGFTLEEIVFSGKNGCLGAISQGQAAEDI